MILWRISNYNTLDGRGGLLAGGRWHSSGRPIVYLADSPASAVLEVLVHLELDFDDLPPNFRLIKIDAPGPLSPAAIDLSVLADTWTHDVVLTRTMGDEWLAGKTTALLRVPSAIVPETYNFLLNPEHIDAPKCTILSERPHPWDKRLF